MLIQLRRWLHRMLCGVILAGAVLLPSWPAWADATVAEPQLEPTVDPPAQLFAVHCAGCHPNGGNIIRRGKTLKAKALQRYGYDDIDSIAGIITNGKGVMSAYGDRLTPAEIEALAQYVQDQAATGW